MDSRIGPEQVYDAGCGFTTDRTHGTFCGKKPVVRHYLFDSPAPDGHYPTGFTCDEHISHVPPNLVKMHHAVTFFCDKPNSYWSFDANECVMDTKEYEQILFGTTTLGDDIIEEFNEKIQDNHTRGTA